MIITLLRKCALLRFYNNTQPLHANVGLHALHTETRSFTMYIAQKVGPSQHNKDVETSFRLRRDVADEHLVAAGDVAMVTGRCSGRGAGRAVRRC